MTDSSGSDPPGPLIASGRAADVYDIGNDKVLRRYRSVAPDLEHEARVMEYVADRGYPVPRVHDVNGTDLVMDRVEGETMIDALAASPWKVVWHARLLARLQRDLARIAAPDWMLADSADSTREQSVLHLDLHPMNVMLSADGPVVIDWTNAAGGPAGFDGAITYVEIITYAPDETIEKVGQQVLARSFRRFRGRQAIDPFIEAACDHRLLDKGTLPDERVAVAALRDRIRKRTDER